ncbi:MAG: dTDP-4-dehydrorhamnose reductase [Candidatus Helarchaeota archaeon]
MKRILIIGANGLLGYNLYQKLKDKFEIYTCSRTKRVEMENFFLLDIIDSENVRKKVIEIDPDVIVLTAAMTRVDLCEKEKSKAWDVNVVGTQNVAEACRSINSKLIYISTDYVFDGTKGKYVENDTTNPISHYGLTKLEGEKRVGDLSINCIVRTSVIYGWNEVFQRQNFVTWMLNQLKSGKKSTIITKWYNTPTLVDNLSEGIIRIITKEKTGLFHIAGANCINRYEFALEIARTFEEDISLITPVDKLTLLARRPEKPCLDVSKASTELGLKLLTTQEGLDYMKKNIKKWKN